MHEIILLYTFLYNLNTILTFQNIIKLELLYEPDIY